jgi:hypothetical protein
MALQELEFEIRHRPGVSHAMSPPAIPWLPPMTVQVREVGGRGGEREGGRGGDGGAIPACS